jgi:outer membrane protein assembly factor BamB
MSQLAMFLAALTISLPIAVRAQSAGDWPQFRGPDGQGHAGDADLPLHWGEDDGVIWKTPTPGRGWSSPVVGDGKIWLTTAEEFEATEAERAAMLKQVEHLPTAAEMIAFGSIALSALEYDLATGELLRRIELFKVDAPPPIHGLNSYASPTPVLEDGRLFCHFGAFGTACVDTATGEVVWRRVLPMDPVVGPGSSPAVVDGLVIIPCDGADKQYVAALNAATGKPAWQVDRPPIRSTIGDLRKAFSTPLAIDADGRRQVVIPGAQWFVAYDPATGEEIWRVDHGGGYSNVPRPIFDGKQLYVSTGYGGPQLWAVRPDGAGEVTETHVAWRQSKQAPTMPSPVVADGRIYMISDAGVASCLDAETGKAIWLKRVAGQYSASPLYGAGRVYFWNHDGRTTVVAADAEFEVLARNDLDGRIMASPAVVAGTFIVRTDRRLYRLGGGE